MKHASPPQLKFKSLPHLQSAAVVEYSLKAGQDYRGIENTEPVRVSYSMQVMEGPPDSRSRQVHLMCTLGNTQNPENLAYSGRIVVIADLAFEPNVEVTADELDMASAWAASNALIGMVRTQVQQLTSMGPYEPLLLGLVNQASVVNSATVVAIDGKSRPLYPQNLEKESLANPAKSGSAAVEDKSAQKPKE